MRNLWVAIIMLFVMAAFGCSGAPDATLPADILTGQNLGNDAGTSGIFYGTYALNFDAVTMNAEIVELRAAGIHYNLTTWLVPPKCDD